MHGSIATILLYLIPLTIGSIWWLLYLILLKPYTIIELRDANTKIGFFKRNKDALLVNIISAFAGVILGIFGTLIVQWLSK